MFGKRKISNMLTFKKLTKEYLEWARQLHNDPDVLIMLTDPHIVSEEEQLIWFEKLLKSNTSERILVLDEFLKAYLMMMGQAL